MTNTVYLSGPSITTVDSSITLAADWKSYAASTFLKSGITIANPIELDLTGFVKNVDESGNAVKHSLTLIDRADSILANLTQITESSTMEIFYASRQGKQVVVIGKEPFSPWVLLHSEARFQKLKEALEYLVNQPAGFDTLSWSSQFESQIKRRAEQYPPYGEHDFEYYGGNAPVLVIAPHATSFFREGNLHESESYTGALAALLHKLTGCHALISSYCMAADPVYYLSSPFVSFIGQLLKKMDFKLVVFLHGLDEWSNQSDLILTSWNKNSLINKKEYLNLLTSLLKVKDINEIGFDMSDLVQNPVKTINQFMFEDLNIPTVRLEIHKRYRLPQLHPGLYVNLHTALSQFLMLISSSR